MVDIVKEDIRKIYSLIFHDIQLKAPPYLLINVSSMKSEQCELCVNSPLYIDARLLWKQAIGSNSP